MSSRQLEDIEDHKKTIAFAKALGITPDEMEALDWSYYPNDSDDGLPYGYILEFGDNADPTVIAKIRGVVDSWVSVGPVDFD